MDERRPPTQGISIENPLLARETLAENLRNIKARIAQAALAVGRDPSTITIVGAAKTEPVEKLNAAFTIGVKQLGENYVQEAQRKKHALAHLNATPSWHMIGHLQTNKAKDAVALFDVIETVDSVRLAEA